MWKVIGTVEATTVSSNLPPCSKLTCTAPLPPKTGAFVGTMVQESMGQHHSLSSCFEQWTPRDVYLKTEGYEGARG